MSVLPPQHPTTTMYMAQLPLAVVQMHAVAKSGNPDRVSRFAQRLIKIKLTDVDRERWPVMFKDADFVWIVYEKEKRG